MKKIDRKGKLIHKLQSNKGETLAETLVAALIGAIGLMVLASMIMSATHSVERGQSKVDALYDGMQQMEKDSSTAKKTPSTLRTDAIQISWEDIPTTSGKIDKGTETVYVIATHDTKESFQVYEK